jgi:flagellin
VYSKLDAALSTTDTAGIGALNTALAAAGAAAAQQVTPATVAAGATAEQLAAIRQTIISQVDAYMSGGLGVQTADAQKKTGLDELSVETQAGAWEAIKQLDSAIDQVNAARGDLGALQTRFEKTVENIDIQNENISAARGRIVDADFATETANLSRSQILQQAGTAMVAQANQLPQNVLSLLR